MQGTRAECLHLLVTVGVVLLSSSTAAAQSPDSSAIRAVLAAEDARFGAMLRADTAALRLMLAEDLIYVHSTARRETRNEFLESIGSQVVRYRAFTPLERRVRLIADGAFVTGTARASVESFAGGLDADVRYLAVYVRAGRQWKLVAWQTTRVP